jgi:hypothetical protein
MLSFTAIIENLTNKKEKLARELLNIIDNYPNENYFTIILTVNPNNSFTYHIGPENENYVNAFGFAINVIGLDRENHSEITLKITQDTIDKAIEKIQSHINRGQIHNY